MNELIEFINNSQHLLALKTWLMEMSLWNLAGLAFILWNTWTMELTVTIDNLVKKTPKYIVLGLTLILMFMYPNNLLYACLPYMTILVLLLTWQKPIFWYLNLFMPAGRKLRF